MVDALITAGQLGLIAVMLYVWYRLIKWGWPRIRTGIRGRREENIKEFSRAWHEGRELADQEEG